jgi:hypothetical protein
MAAPFVSFDVQYEPAVAGGPAGEPGSEVYPLRCDAHGTHQLSHYGSKRANDSLEHVTVFERRARSHKFSVRIEAHSNRLFMPYQRGGAYSEPIDVAVVRESSSSEELTVANSSTVILYFYATTFSESGQACWSHVGTALLSVQTLLQLRSKTTTIEAVVVQNRDNDARTPINHPLVKGRVVISNVRTERIAVRAVATRYDIDTGAERMQEAAELMDDVIDRGMLAYFGQTPALGGQSFLTRPTRPFLRPFHCPEFRTERMPLPASAYSMLMPSGALDVDYYERLVTVALYRSGMTRSEALLLARDCDELSGTLADRAAFASFAVRAMCVFAVSQCYVSDFLNHNVDGARGQQDAWAAGSRMEGDEDFKVCRLCGGDDCEGVALEVHMHVRQLCHTTDTALLQRMSPLLRAVRSHLRLYVPTLVLGAVTNKKLTTQQLDQSAVMAHTYAVLLPYWQFYDASASPVRTYLQRSRFYRERADELAPYRREPLTALIGEGTAPMDPAMRPVSAYYAAAGGNDDDDDERVEVALKVARDRRRYTDVVASQLAAYGAGAVNMEVFGAPDTNRSDYSPFYKYSVSLATPEFADLRTFDWALVYQRDSEQQRTVGVRIESLLDPGSTRVPTAQIIPFVDMSEEECRTADAILLDQEPVPSLTAGPQPATQSVGRVRLVQQLCAKGARQTDRAQLIGARQTVLHRRQTFLTVRECDIDGAVVNALLAIVGLRETRAARFAFHTLNTAVDGTANHNRIFDLSLEF